MRSKWDEMYKALVAFREANGHCNVSASDKKYRRLGQWVSSQRYKKRIGSLSKDKTDALNKVGFVWSAAEQTWQRMFNQLAEYARKHKTTDIPERFPENQKLSNWVHNQRHRKKIGRLDRQRVRQLEKIGFCWVSRNGEGTANTVAEGEKRAEPITPPSDPALSEERLYMIRAGRYIQHHGKGRRPVGLQEYVRSHGEDPPYIPLPQGKVIFILGNEFYGGKRIEWPGKGDLPEDVLRHVRENGTLPHYEPAAG